MSDNYLDDAIKKSLSEESVDDILSGILNPDGTFNEAYNNLFAKYMGIEENSEAPAGFDLSDRSSDIDAEFISGLKENDSNNDTYRATEESIVSKLGPNSGAYVKQVNEERKPTFTSGGDVRYPSIGSGASEERIVYDADWENKAKQEAERLKRYSETNPYTEQKSRSFVAGGEDLSRNSYRPVIEQSSSPFVDPISEDDDFDRYWARQYEQNQKKSFFQEGLRANRSRNDTADAGDRNQKNSSDNRHNNRYSSGDWLTVEKNRKSGKYRKDRSAIPDRSPLPRTSDNPGLNSSGIISSKSKTAQKTYITKTELSEKQAEAETQDLRDTVAAIVDKYDRKNQEELLAKAKAEKLRLELEKKEQEEKALQQAVKAKKRLGISETVCEALDAEEEKPFNQEIYDDFSADAEEGFENI